MEERIFAKRIKELRIKNKVSQQELATHLDMTPTGVSYWESGKSVPSLETIQKIADFFNVTIEYLTKDIEMDENDRRTILFRKAGEVPEKEKERLYDIIDSTIDIFLKSNNKEG